MMEDIYTVGYHQVHHTLFHYLEEKGMIVYDEKDLGWNYPDGAEFDMTEFAYEFGDWVKKDADAFFEKKMQEYVEHMRHV